jgi:hypothetical protein
VRVIAEAAVAARTTDVHVHLTSWPSIVAAIAGGVAAIASCASAFAAWRSAGKSADAARDASRALAVIMFPRLRHHVYQQVADRDDETISVNRWHLDVWNESSWDAVEVRAHVRLTDGRTFKGEAERLRPARESPPRRDDEQLVIEIPSMPADNKQGYAMIAETVVRWRDAQRIARWEARRDWTHGYAAPFADTIRQIEGPAVATA